MKWLWITLSLLLSGCMTFSETATIPLSEMHQPSGLNNGAQFDGLSFVRYERLSRKMIAEARTDLGNGNGEQIIEGNAPFDLKPPQTCAPGKNHPYRRGVLLTHGLTDSPYFMRNLGRFFQKNCFRVMAILLSGHGTRPGDLLDVHWKEWVRAEAFGTDALAAEVDEVYLLGFSTGGTLSIFQSLDDPRVRGLFLFSPAIKISPMAIMANWHKSISWMQPRAKWIDILEDEDPFKYESFPFNAADQIHLLSKALRSRLDDTKMTIPVFVAASEDDSTVSTPDTNAFFRRAENPLNKMILYSTKNGSTPPNIEIVNSRFPEAHILSSAHTAITLPPEDPHYGVNGDYRNCIHYFVKAFEKYKLCKDKKENYIGELTDENLEQGVIRRLMYNPNYQALETSLMQFIDSLP